MRAPRSVSRPFASIWALAFAGLLTTDSNILAEQKVKPSQGTDNPSAAPATAEDVSEETLETCKSQLRQLLESEMEAEVSHLAKTVALSDETVAALQSASA